MQGGQLLCQCEAVACHGYGLQAQGLEGMQLLNDLQQIPPHCRLTTCQTDLGDTRLDKKPGLWG
jgi:hypothetical protein